MSALIEIIIDGVKKFGGEIIAAVPLAVALWVFPGLRKIFRKKNGSSEEVQKLLEAIETRRKEEERLKDALKQANPQLKHDEEERLKEELKQREEALRQAEAKMQEEAKRREEVQKQLEAQRQEQERIKAEIQRKEKLAQEEAQKLKESLKKSEVTQSIEGGPTDAKSQYELGNKYYKARNYDEAAKWYRLAAEQDYSPAQCELGWMYYDGDGGVDWDYEEALKWYLKAAQKGNAKAEYWLGVMYANGYGVMKDEWEARKWFYTSAAHGYFHAEVELQRRGWKLTL